MRKTKVANFARRLSASIKERVSRMSRSARIVSGMTLLICGVLGFLPILGFWMIPLGLLILSTEFHWANRAHQRWLRFVRRIQAWQRQRRLARRKSDDTSSD